MARPARATTRSASSSLITRSSPTITVIAPWREWDLTSRGKLIEFAEQHQIPIAKDKRGEAPFSTDANLLHTSSEGKVLEDPAAEVPDYVYSRTDDPATAPDKPAVISLDFEKGDAVAVDGRKLSPAALLAELNALGKKHGIGRLDLVENRFVGMKSRGMYETPGGTILLAAHRGIESITLDRGAAHLKDELMPRYAEMIYNGFWFAPEREMLQAAIDRSQEFVSGRVMLRLHKGNVAVIGRESKYSLYDQDLGDVRGRRRRLRSSRRAGFHPAQRAAPAHSRAAKAQAEKLIDLESRLRIGRLPRKMLRLGAGSFGTRRLVDRAGRLRPGRILDGLFRCGRILRFVGAHILTAHAQRGCASFWPVSKGVMRRAVTRRFARSGPSDGILRYCSP